MSGFKEFFAEADFVLFDGAVGTQIYARGVPKGHCYDELNLSLPETIQEIHREYVEAGAQVITTNTFGANAFILEEYFALGDKTREINYYGARLARQAVRGRAYVAGSIGPVTRPLDTDKKIDFQDLRAIFQEQIEALLEGGVDLLVLETFADLDELLLAIQVARQVAPDIFILAETSFPNNGLTLFGKNPYEVGFALEKSEADALGSNCGTGPQSVLETIKKMARVTRKPLSAMPNAGLAQFVNGKFYYPFNPEYFVRYGQKLLQAGVKILGGCCGTTPEHIRRMAAELKGLKPRSRSLSLIGPVTTTAPKVYKERIETQYKTQVEKGWAVSVELDPPKDPNIGKFLKKIERIAPYIQAYNISDCPMARARMSSIATGNIIQQQLQKEVVIHYTCRDRNILGIQSDLLGAAALGLNNILTLGGDPPAVGDYPFATGVYDLTTEGLVQLCSALNHGRDLLGNPLGRPTHFYIGVGYNINDQSLPAFNSLVKKINQGAHFVVTQPVFNLASCWPRLEELKKKNIPVIVGALPLTSFKQAEYFHYEVPGIIIPEKFLARLEKLKAKEAEKEGVKITIELINELKPAINGILLMISFNKLYLLEEIMAKI